MRQYFSETHNRLISLQKKVRSGTGSLTLLMIAHIGVVTSIFWSPGLLSMMSTGLPGWVQLLFLMPLVACMVAVTVFAAAELLVILLTVLFELAAMPMRVLLRNPREII